MMNPATLPITGYDGSASDEVQQYWLDVAWRGLQGEVPDLAARAIADEHLLELAADVVTAAARRVLRNPDGVGSESGQIDDYSESWKRADPTEDIYFTAAELRRLAGGSTAQGWSGSLRYC